MDVINLSEVNNIEETVNNLDYGQVVKYHDKTYVILADSKSDEIYLHPCCCNPETIDIPISKITK